MNKKNILTAAVSLSLVACLSIGATLAYFTDKSDVKTNVFESGKVKITLTDDGSNPDLALGEKAGVENAGKDGFTYENVQPGDLLAKDVYVDVDPNSSDCYVGLRLEFITDPDSTMPNVAALQKRVMDAMDRAGTSADWTVVSDSANPDDMILITDAVAGERLEVFDNIQIPDEWGNEYSDATFSIKVTAYAAQKDHLTASMFQNMINGLPIEVDGQEKVVEFEKAK